MPKTPDNPSLFSKETAEYLTDAQKRIDAIPKPPGGMVAEGHVPPFSKSLRPPWDSDDTIHAQLFPRPYPYGKEKDEVVDSMHRHPDHATSVEAATRVSKKLSELQTLVYGCFVRYGPMTDEELEGLPEIVDRELGKTTARRRRTDLVKLGRLFAVGTRVNKGGLKMTLWAVVPTEKIK